MPPSLPWPGRMSTPTNRSSSITARRSGPAGHARPAGRPVAIAGPLQGHRRPARRGRSGQSLQERVPGQHLPRASHAAARHPELRPFRRRRGRSGDRGELREFFQNVGRSAETLLQLVNDLLDLSKLEAGRMMFDLQPACVDTWSRSWSTSSARFSPGRYSILFQAGRHHDHARRSRTVQAGDTQPAEQRGQVLAAQQAPSTSAPAALARPS